MTNTKTTQILRYQAIFDPCEEGGFSVTVPKLPGLVTEGDTYEQAMKNTKDAINGYLLVLRDAKEPIPETDDTSFSTPIDVSYDSKGVAYI